MENETPQTGLGTMLNASDKNVKLIRIVAEWWRSAQYLQENKSRFEPNELEAFEYILATPKRGQVDEDKFGVSVTLIREISYQTSDQFGAEASNFAGKSNKILKDIKEFAEALESQQMKSSAGVNINQIKRKNPVQELGGSAAAAKSKAGASEKERVINGNTWTGTFDEAGHPYGSGTIYYADGSVYTGQWSLAGPHGNGKIVQADGDVWEALFRDGKPVDGKIFYNNGNRYEGGLNENGRNGIGRTFTENYEEFGQYTDDSRVGNGKIVFKNGDFYEGGWNDKGPHGRGTIFDSVNKRTDTGDFLNGKRHGSGRMVWGNTNTCYEGTWFDTPNGMEGQGVTYILPNGQRTPIRYINGKPVLMNRPGGGQPPYNPNVRTGQQQTAYNPQPSSYSLRNALGIIMGVIFGLASTANLENGEFLSFVVCFLFVLGAQALFAGKFNSATGETTKKVMYSPLGLTSIFLLLFGFINLFNSFGWGFFSMAIGLVLLINIIRK